MAITARTGEYTVIIEREMIEVTMGWTPTPNESWRYTDLAGHDHYWDHGYPTLNFIVDEQHWCEGDEGWMHHDPHWHVDEAHYECKVCREGIEPTMDPPGFRKFIPGMLSGTVEGLAADGWVKTVAITGGQCERFTPDADWEALACGIVNDPDAIVISAHLSG